MLLATVPTVTVSDSGGTYNGSSFPATALVEGASSLEGVTPTVAYYAGSSASGPPLAAAPSTVGIYTTVASFAGSTNYDPADSSPVTFTIVQATPTVTVIDVGGTYSGSPFVATTSVTGVDGVPGATLEGVGLTVTYYVGSSVSGTGTSTAPSTAGTYTVQAVFAGSTDYTSAQNTVTFTIGKATPTVTVTDVGGTYRGSSYPATARVAGVDGVTRTLLEGVGLTVTYYVGSSVSGTGTSTAPTTAGTYTAQAVFAGSTDYTSAQNTVTFTVAQATPTVTVADAGGTYTGSAYPATARVAGIDGVRRATLEGVGLTVTYYAGSSTSGAVMATAPYEAGTYTVVASFAGSTDYVAADSSAVTFTIAQATPTIRVTATGGPYTGAEYVATALVNGASSLENVSPTISYYIGRATSGTPLTGAPSVAGTYTAVAAFAGSTNYRAVSGSVSFAISKVNTTTSLVTSASTLFLTEPITLTATVASASATSNAPTGTVVFYDGATTLGTGTLSTANGATTATLTTTMPDSGNRSVTAVYQGDTSYNRSASTVVPVVVKRWLLLVSDHVNNATYGKNMIFTVTMQTPTAATVTGTIQFVVDGVNYGSPVRLQYNQASLLSSNLSVGTHTITAVYSANGSLVVPDGQTSDPMLQRINRAALTITADAKLRYFGQQNPTLTATYRGLTNGDTASSLTVRPTLSTTATTQSAAGKYTITITGASSSNYTITMVGGTLTLIQPQNTAFLGADPLDSTKLMLLVYGTTSKDSIRLTSGVASGSVMVSINGVSKGTFLPTSRILVHALAGNDLVQVARTVTTAAWLYADSGNDVLYGGGGKTIVIGGSGNDTLLSGTGASILISNGGADQLTSWSGNALLVAGTTSYTANDTALAALLAEWGSTSSYALRAAHISGTPGGLNGSYYLNAMTVRGVSSAHSTLRGKSADMFLKGSADTMLGYTPGETVITLRY